VVSCKIILVGATFTSRESVTEGGTSIGRYKKAGHNLRRLQRDMTPSGARLLQGSLRRFKKRASPPTGSSKEKSKGEKKEAETSIAANVLRNQQLRKK